MRPNESSGGNKDQHVCPPVVPLPRYSLGLGYSVRQISGRQPFWQ